MGEALPEGWPLVSSSDFAASSRILQQRLGFLYDFLDKDSTQSRIQRLFARFYAESARHLLELDYHAASDALFAEAANVSLLRARPEAEVRFDQLYCTPDSTQRRAEKIRELTMSAESRVLFVGDDDLTSILLAREFAGEIHVIDLDERLLEFIAKAAPSVRCHKLDLILGGIPAWMYQHFDTVILDPPWDIRGAWAFLSRALYCLRDHVDARILLAFCPVQMELIGSQMRQFWQRLARHGLFCEGISHTFHLYDLAPMNTEAYRKAFGLYLPTIESPLFERLRETPFTFSHLYEIRRIQRRRPRRLRDALLRWWLTDSSAK
jgi:hypothetical protein